MAESKVTTDDLTCPICVEIYQEPVSLPCAHSYCRSCLELFVKAENGASHDVHACPVCRASVNLNRTEVTALPINIKLAVQVEKAKGQDLRCSMCEDESKMTAVKLCTTCNTLYCEECFAALHPMRGPLKRHKVCSPEEVLGHQTEDGPVKKPGPEVPTCDQHGDHVSLFCAPCSKLVCKECLSDHEKCSVEEMQKVSDRIKVTPFTQFLANVIH